MGRKRSVVVCEIPSCRRALRHDGNGGHERGRIEVGRKLTGTPRCICNRTSCKEKWEADGAHIRATWPEVRDRIADTYAEIKIQDRLRYGNVPPLPKPVEQAAPKPAAPKPQPLEQVPMDLPEPKGAEMNGTNKQPPALTLPDGRKIGRRFYYSAAADKWISDFLERNGFRFGDGLRVAYRMREERPDLVRFEDTKELVAAESVAQHVSTVARALGYDTRSTAAIKRNLGVQPAAPSQAVPAQSQTKIVLGPVHVPGGDPPIPAAPQVRSARYLSMLSKEITDGVARLVGVGDVATLEAIADLLGGN